MVREFLADMLGEKSPECPTVKIVAPRSGDQRTLNSAGSVAFHHDLKAFAVERQLGLMHGLAVSVRSHFDTIEVVRGRFQDENGEPFLPEHASQRKHITFTRRSCYLQ